MELILDETSDLYKYSVHSLQQGWHLQLSLKYLNHLYEHDFLQSRDVCI